MATRPSHIEIIRRDGRLRVLIDGNELPCPIARAEPLDVPVHPDEMPLVRLTLIADTVTVTNTLHDQDEEESERPQ
ncbi:hypothetical protein [Streptomyces sp. DH37]|uniref:hypothetical protein n=1 Tax=Streptomyces sp. DH37 TaxID=3040122 RepID=UPI002441CD5C|nr:hypothetical protein [Streptomyces sp. DH37]MDG9705543.1 hypothetical protein [Streptomyces sp. DH37]